MAVPQIDQPPLLFPEDLTRQPTLTPDSAASMLLKAADIASKGGPFIYKFIDAPPDGSMFVSFQRPDVPPLQDGIRWLDADQRGSVNLGQVEVEVVESRLGFVPGKEGVAGRVRRKYRVIRGGHPSFVLYHYSRGPQQPVPPQLAMAPIRAYPLNHPQPGIGVIVLGERAGTKVALGPGGPRGPQGPPQDPRQVALAQQNREMERQRQAQAQAQQRAGAPPSLPPVAARLDEETDAAEDIDHISTRTLAATRYKRNHDLMSEVFVYAAFNARDEEKPVKPYQSHFNKTELEDKIAKLTEELQDLRSRSARKVAEQSEFDIEGVGADVPMVGA